MNEPQSLSYIIYTVYINISYLYRSGGRCAVVCSGVCVFCDYIVFMDPKCYMKHLYSICDLISYNKYSSAWFKGQLCVCVVFFLFGTENEKLMPD